MIRSIRPTDFASFLAFVRKGHSNDAKTGRNLGLRERRLYSVGQFFQEWLSLDEDRYTWVDIVRRRIRGLISVRARPSPTSWQVDTLIVPPGADCQDISLGLLDYISAVGSEVGVYKVFLRLQRDSILKETARQAGYQPYKAELLYWRERLALPPGAASAVEGAVRSKRPTDDLPLFHLYSAQVPGHIREAEAMTLDEWRAIWKKDLNLPTEEEFVLEKNGSLVGWLRLRSGRHVNSFDVLASNQEPDNLEILLTYCMGKLDYRRPTYCLFAEARDDLRRSLDERGFCLAGEYSCFIRQLAVRVRQPRFVPARI